MSKIGVLLPVYKNDDEHFLHQSIESIVMQSYRDFVVFVGVDGPVNDSVRDYLQLLENQHTIKVFWFKENRGLACVLNDLIAEAKKAGCTYYARMDADDISQSERFEKQVAFLEKH